MNDHDDDISPYNAFSQLPDLVRKKDSVDEDKPIISRVRVEDGEEEEVSE
jgi:hypothetical protein